ncbi:MAG: 2-oxo acid dehydrogenase subunit E2 [Flavobacteriia bacterium]|nr:2-oxo acid dehydrogenase subunit E2 [Flavobacteriia bacterium]
MAQIEIKLPKMGESVTEATITNWLKNIGDQVELDEPLVEVATDKVDNELPSEAKGILIKRFFEKDQVAQVGDVIALISSDGLAVEEIQTPVVQQNNTSSETVVEKSSPITNNSQNNSISSNRFYSPLVKSIADKEGINYNELEQIPGTGQDGRVSKKDILQYVENRKNTIQTPDEVKQETVQTSTPILSNHSNVTNATVKPEPVIIPNSGDEIIEMDRMRKLIAEHMLMSVHTSPHVTSFVEADVTNIVIWRNKIKKVFEQREGESITFTPIFIEAVSKAIKDFPMINVSVSGNHIIKRKDINIGMATALPSGNLIVPVIKNADRFNLTGLTKTVNELAKNARNNKLKPEDIQGGTYTVTNVGSFGNVMGTPIINQPQVAIMALGAIRKIPAVIETPEGDFIGIRHKMFLSHSYDHRVVDGALGGQFVRRVADYLEQFDINREL